MVGNLFMVVVTFIVMAMVVKHPIIVQIKAKKLEIITVKNFLASKVKEDNLNLITFLNVNDIYL